jgi:hypothetical protein
LFAKAKDVVPEFLEAIKKNLYKKRSIALNSDLTLRHIGFLGGTPPAIKGLKNIAFKEDDEFFTYEYNEPKPSEEEKLKAQIAEQEKEIEQLKSFKEDNTKLNSELETANANLKETKIQLEAVTRERNEKIVDAFVESKINEGKILPAERGVVTNLLLSFSLNDEKLDYSDELTLTPAKTFYEFIDGLGKRAPIKKEVDDKKPKQVNVAELAEGIKSVMNESKKNGKTISYSQAKSIFLNSQNQGEK